MEFTVEEAAFPLNTSSNQSLFGTGHSSEALPRSLSQTSASHDDLEQDRTVLKTFSGNSSSLYGDLAPRREYRATQRSLHPRFCTSQATELALKKQSFQEQYWTCAIPDSPPPCPDRTSPQWDPNKEYQDLLDYTYPLNPKYFIYKDSEESDTDPFFHDSGIDLDSYNISYYTKVHSPRSQYQKQPEVKSNTYSRFNHLSSPCAYSTPLFKKARYRNLRKDSESSNEASFEELSPCTSKGDLHKEPSDAEDILKEKRRSSSQFIPTTQILQLNPELESDEEFLSLPPHLKEIENLATHLKDLSLNIKQTGAQGKAERQPWFSYGPEVEVKGIKERIGSEDVTLSQPSYLQSDLEGSKLNNLKHGDSGTSFNKFFSLRDMLDGGESSSSLEFGGSSFVPKVHGTRSLVHIIQGFCQHLDQLIQWLYSFAELSDNWVEPKPNVESIQLSLSLYLKLKKTISEHQLLADTVMKDGELLLKHLSLNSSVLKDTLALISKQRGELDRQVERLYASVLEAMETISDDSLGRTSNLKQCVSLEMESN
ncbi:hypothetical protein XENTR_v10013497 [Xenopus tropicalis]|uniref:Centrosomal protein 68kDa n=1 Tax=Xenopus tropicalis TaxID=8364 RepID=Q0V9Y9_XENTR|nr:centrosomal protein of 68 kDa [Xenopus tropicalis]XP_012818594.1 centrosomal protein of 68 kDa isoform X1 [Xenopus tropicalis]XP_012818595.1 centrosomal protein of 68 kDa isoform X1 [Xenopus tropicalis]XP_031757640.1 centrosomal protein of 68 kDa isoform X1 [Xenopus tropicalis]XP_031757641.1 centrosomal protein of 68 kDa isoform X1 [Xenopus tropicalis]XP_031757642.1 centrosomal protein of 68 kDa isoform X1 [Xenopus tropicalis]AAI21343.1 hypothetical protein MGC145706 [Xenopus tropicalis]K|eukprot:XP_012818591.1 PREDICTED: centrosomal protein of 68 kDa isoform X1 [Xenopus tropicalis]